MEEKYKKIINLTHHASPTRKKMEIKDRAAQFAPYAALTGFGDVVNETSRITERRIIPDNQVIEKLNRTIVYLLLNSDKAEAKFTFFIEDERKAGGKYVTKIGRIKSADEIARTLSFEDGYVLSINNIIDIKML